MGQEPTPKTFKKLGETPEGPHINYGVDQTDGLIDLDNRIRNLTTKKAYPSGAVIRSVVLCKNTFQLDMEQTMRFERSYPVLFSCSLFNNYRLNKALKSQEPAPKLVTNFA